MRRGLAFFGLLSLLGSCSPPGPEIRVKVVGKRITFEAIQSEGWPTAHEKPAPLTPFRVVVQGQAGPTWVIERRGDGHCAASTEPGLNLTYGEVPDCFRERLRATALRPYTPYRIRVDTYGSSVRHTFQLVLTSENLDFTDAGREAEQWPIIGNDLQPANGN